MFRPMVLLTVATGMLLAVTPAVAAAQSVTATGTDSVRVKPTDRHSNASIVAAVRAAQNDGIAGAVTAAHARALKYSAAVGLTLGPVESISDVTNDQIFIGPLGSLSNQGPFGPNRYCGIERHPVIKVVDKRPKVVRVRKVHACVVPALETTSLAVTYSASAS